MALLIVAAVENELRLLKTRLDARPAGHVVGHPYDVALSGRTSVYLSQIGVGLTSAALALGALVATIFPSEIIMVGSAGSLPGSGLQTGQLVVASSETLSEFGVYSDTGVGSVEGLGITGVSQEMSLDRELAGQLAEAALENTSAEMGRFLTVVGVSEDLRLAEARANRFSALVENMEGFALALAGDRFGIRVGEVRGVSNLAGIRDKTTWDLDLANQQAQAAVLTYLRRRF
jgi:futalosine hydrolase